MTTSALDVFTGWRTLAVSVGIAALGAVQMFLQSSGASVIPAPYIGPALVGVGLAMAYLRSVTKTPVGQAGPSGA